MALGYFSRRALQCATLALLGVLQGCGGGSSEGGGSTAEPGAPLTLTTGVSGWASQGAGTTGGDGAPATNIYVVHNRAELKAALANQNSPTWSATNATAQDNAKKEAKIIYLAGTIYGTDLGNGKFADEAYYKSTNATAAKWDWNLYVQSLDTAYMADLAVKVAALDTVAIDQNNKIKALGSARTTLSNIQKAQIELVIPSNTTILGVGADAKLIDGYFSVNASNNIIVRNLEVQAPIDLTTSYDTTKKEWNARFKAFSVVTGKQLWVDHCTFTDGSHLDTEILTINGYTLPVMRHDGLLDIEDGSDYITVSYSLFKNHDKTNMVGGSGDGNSGKDRGYNHLTFSNNIWADSVQRAPRVRFGQVHVYNNSYSGNTDDSVYPANYYIGMGAESKILSEANVFDMAGSKATVARVMSNLNGYQFKDVGSWFNGVPASAELEAAAKAALEARWADARKAADGTATPQPNQVNSVFILAAYTNDLGWTPSYSYTRGGSADDVRAHNLANSGAGKLAVTASSDTRPQLSDAQAATYTVAKALAGSDAWAPQTTNIGHVDTSSITPDFIVAQDGSGTHTTIQSALNAASAKTTARTYIQVKAGTFNELLIAASTTTAITLYSTESDAGKVVVANSLYQNSIGTEYAALVPTSTYTGNADATTAYNLCAKKTGTATIGKECSTTLRVRNNGFNAVNITFQNNWGDTDAGGNNQALAVMIDKADKVVFDNARLISNQDTLYLSNSGKRSYFVGGEIAGDIDFIFGPGTAVFDSATIRYVGTRKPAGGYIAAPSTLATQLYGFMFNNCLFIADAATTKDSVYLSRQWDDGTGSVGKMIVRNSVLGEHIALTTGPWNATTVNKAAVVYKDSVTGEPYLAEYRNWQMAAVTQTGSSSSAASSSAVSSASSSAASSSAASSSSSVSAGVGSDTPIAGSTTLANAFVSTGLPTAVATTFDSATGKYSLVSAGVMLKGTTTADTLQFAYKQATGNFTFVARLTSLYDANTEGAICSGKGECRAGVMIRNSLDAGSRYYGLSMRGTPRLQWEQRVSDGAPNAVSSSTLTASYTTLPSTAAPLWLKLVRFGQVITVSFSVDGINWQGAKSIDFTAATYTPFGDTVYIGLMGVSGTNTGTNTSTFDNVTLTAN